MESLLYVLWFAIPSIFFLLALWVKLERVSGKGKTESPRDLFNQGLFTLACVFLCVAIDKLFLTDIVENLPDLFPLGFYKALLLPFVLLLGAKFIGPSKKILIVQKSDKPQRTNSKRRK